MAKMSWLRRKSAEEEPDVPPEAEAIDAMPSPELERREDTERERQLHGLAVLSLFLHSTGTIEEMMAKLLDQAPTVTGAVFVYPLMLDRKRQLLRASILEGCTDSRLEAAMDAFQEDLTALEFSLVRNDGLYRMLDEGEVVLVDSLQVLMDEVVSEEQWRAAEDALQLSKVAFVPMIVESEPLGLVVFAFDQDDVDVEALELLVGHLTLALRDLLVRDEVVRFSDVDPVTWVHSRRYLTQTIDSEMVRTSRYGRGFSLVLLDIDNFAQFNETYGQSTGDRLLRSAGTALAETVSAPEIVARIKDDDFAILLPETDRAEAVTTTAKMLGNLSQLSVFAGAGEEDQPITFSAAIACYPEDAGTSHALLERAQADLETAKRERMEEQKPARKPVDPVARAAADSNPE